MRGNGSTFYELDALAGYGCSGGPVIAYNLPGHKQYQVIGIYKGERQTTGGNGIQQEIALATRTSAIGAWAPDILGKSLFEEANPPPGTKPLAIRSDDLASKIYPLRSESPEVL